MKNGNLHIGIFLALSVLLAGCNTTAMVEVQAIETQSSPPPSTNNVEPIKRLAETRSPSPYQSKSIEKPNLLDRENVIYFPPRLATIDKSGINKLKNCAERLKQDSRLDITLIGYSDESGSKSYNLAITEQRIGTVSSVLKSFGVKAKQIRKNRSNSVKSATQKCHTEDCHQQMGRIEFLCGR